MPDEQQSLSDTMTSRLSEPQGDAGDEMVSHWSKADGAAGNVQPVEVHVAKLVLAKERPMAGQIETESDQCLWRERPAANWRHPSWADENLRAGPG